ncbi:MAG TPA: TetR family transcriptional regulator [Candidatus Dormibacteraeota bacterium]|nr:TetR family transcriptional regulator [Candidatus Dormibacteraeota bacterium]
MSNHDRPALGLRERKKARTRSEIQRQALRLFREQGYEATTVGQIAAAAEVSESTFFRYFPTKEAVVLRDDLDEALVAAFEAQPAHLGPLQAMRAALRAVFDRLSEEERREARERAALVLSVPELRAAGIGELVETFQRVSELMARRAGRPAHDLAVRTLAGALLGAMLAVVMEIVDHPEADYVERLDAAMAYLEAGLPL